MINFNKCYFWFYKHRIVDININLRILALFYIGINLSRQFNHSKHEGL